MRIPHYQLSANVMVKLYHYLVYAHLTYALLAWGRSGRTNAAKIKCAHRRACKLLTDYNQKILTFPFYSYDYFALLQAFNTNTLNFHQYLKDKLSSYQPSHIHNTRHRTHNKLILHYLWNSPRWNIWNIPRCIKLEGKTDSAIQWRKKTGVTSRRGSE